MKDDLLILQLLKIPVTVIKYLSKFVAMLTYLPNYLTILALDTIIFHPSLSKTLLAYCISWPLRLISLITVVSIFTFQFYGLYSLLSIQHFHWGIQLALSFVAFQGVLALMRHGYLTMIRKYSPTKLKSPLQHLEQLWFMVVDIGGLFLTIINTLLIVNILGTLKYSYSQEKRYNYLRHIAKLIHCSILDILKLFYIKIFFRLFPWRYIHSKQDVDKEQESILQLMVLLSLLCLQTALDLVVFALFGFYSRILHPRRKVYARNISATHQKYKITLKFLANTLIQIGQCLILLFCLPFKFSYSKQVLSLVVDKNNDYSFHYIQQTLFVLKLALVKIPSLFCQLVLLVFYYKYKKINYLSKKKNNIDSEQKQLFINKLKADQNSNENSKGLKDQKKYWSSVRLSSRQFLVFQSFGSLITQLPYYPLIAISTLLKLWNISWLKYLVDEKQDLRKGLIIDYFLKTGIDYLYFVPALILITLLSLYDPIKEKKIIQQVFKTRQKLKQDLKGNAGSSISSKDLVFYHRESAILPMLTFNNLKQIREDIFFLPLFFGLRLSLLSLMGCQGPLNSVELLEQLWMKMYMARVKKSGHYQQYCEFYKIDKAAGMIKNKRQELRFWKFAHKSIRQRLVSKLISLLLPKKLAEKAIANSELCRNHSAISNHYWNQYNITVSLLKCWIFFLIQCIVTLIGVVILMPLTLWRMPTFIILFRIHDYKKKMFFKILFPMYKQMVRDILTIPIKSLALILFTRASLSFYFKTAFRYTSKGIQQFQKVQRAKLWFVGNKILLDGLFLYMLFWKVLFVKLFWVRKRDMNLTLKNNNIRLSVYMKDFLLTPQSTPTVPELMQISQKNKVTVESIFAEPQQNSHEMKLKDINQRGQQIKKIVDVYFQQTIDDLPYLLIMVFLLFTLPWRVFYISNALFLMRDDKSHRGQFLRLLKLLAKDYLCIFLYFLLFISIVKTRRAFTLFYRNFKLNFYVGTLRYSHLKQLKLEVKQAGHFYKSLIILLIGCCFGPYRIAATYRQLKMFYRLYRDEKFQEETNKKIYENTIKQGKSLQLITKIGNNSLQHVFRFLNAKQLTRMTRVSRYMYETIKERDDVWLDQWDRVYSAKYPNFQVKNDTGVVSYNAMCIQKFKLQNANLVKQDDRDRFYNLALKQFNLSVYSTRLNIKQELRKFLPQSIFQKIFTSLHWNQLEGYGPEDNWPQPDDNPQHMMILNIQRRGIDILDESQAALSWLFLRPVQYLIIKLNHFYDVDSHRRKKQLLYALSITCYVPFLLFFIYYAWGWMWQFTIFFGYKLLFVVYFAIFNSFFVARFKKQSRRWISLNPYNLIHDIVAYWLAAVDWSQRKSNEAKQYIHQKGNQYIIRPIKRVFNYIGGKAKKVGKKMFYFGNLFYEKVAKPLYISISHKIVAVWTVFKQLVFALQRSLIKFIHFVKYSLTSIYNFLFSIVKGISSLYSNFLQYFLRLSLKFGTIGELIFTIVIIAGMISPSIMCFCFYYERWFIIFSTLASLVLVVTGYKHLIKIKGRVLNG